VPSLFVRLLVRSSEHYLHGVVSAAMLLGEKKLGSVNSMDDIVKEVGQVMGVSGFRSVHTPSLEKDLLHMDEVREEGREGWERGGSWRGGIMREVGLDWRKGEVGGTGVKGEEEERGKQLVCVISKAVWCRGRKSGVCVCMCDCIS